MARIPSIGLLSTFSRASENSFPKLPVSVIRIASAPVIGPGPKARDRTMVKISASTPRTKSSTRRTANRSHRAGVKLRAARKASGSAIIAAPKVPRNAMRIVSPMAQATSPWRQISLVQMFEIISDRLVCAGFRRGPQARLSAISAQLMR